MENDAYKVVMDALVAGQTKIHLPAGTYTVSNTIQVNNIVGVEIYGDGSTATILTLNPNANNPVIRLNGCNGFHIHDLLVNGNRQNQAVANTSTMGVSAIKCSDGIIENCLIHDCHTSGVELAQPFNNTVQNNSVLNCDANGITVNTTTAGSDNQVLNNLVDGASDVGITNLGANNALVQGNTVQNINLSTSPFRVNSHIGIGNEGSVYTTAYTIKNNIIKNCYVPISSNGSYGSGMWISRSSSLTVNITGNELIGNETGIKFVNGLYQLNVTGNTISGVGDVTHGQPLLVASTGTYDIEQNIIQEFPAAMTHAIIQLLTGTGKFVNNTIHTNGNKVFNSPIQAGWITSPNTITL
jgi:hypothetical protein